jgi:hypothetical protein
MELSSTNNEVLPSGMQDHTREFSEVVKSSEARVRDEMLNSQTPKRGRGRPRKSDSSDQPKARPTNSIPSNGSQAVQGLTPTPSIATFIAPPLRAISMGPARKHGIPELALSDDEAKMCADSLDAVLKAFAPSIEQMNPKTGAIIGLCSTVGVIAFTKYSIYSQVQEARMAHVQEVVNKSRPKENEPEAPQGIIPATNYFRKEAA